MNIAGKMLLRLSAASMLVPVAALAQAQAGQPAPPVETARTPASVAATGAASTTSPQGASVVGQSQAKNETLPQDGLAEIVVTAQQRGENLQKVAVPVAVVSGADLISAGVGGLQSLGKLVPSLIVQGTGQGNLVFIRGVGNFSFAPNSDPAAAFSFDGVYIGRSSSTFGTFYDLERVEVLKGPQGTLYGRNATAGAINIIPVQPKLGTWSGYATASYGNYSAVTAEGAINAPLGENAALRVSGTYIKHDGYLKDGTQAEDTGGVRAQLKVNLNSAITVRIEADYAHQGGVGSGSTYVGRYDFNPATGQFSSTLSGLAPSEGLFTPAAQAYRVTNGAAGQLAGRFLDPLTIRPFQNNDAYGVGIHVDWKTPIGTVTVLPAWRHAKKNLLTTDPGGYSGDDQDANQYSVEARLVSDKGRLFDYILGAYYFSEEVDDNTHISSGALAVFQQQRFTTHSPSAYGRLTLHATERLRFTGGVRYTEDHKAFTGLSRLLAVVCVVPTGCPNAPLLPYTTFLEQQPVYPTSSGGIAVSAPGVLIARADSPSDERLTTHKLTYRGAVEFDVGPRSLLYASVETGYRAGGFNTVAPYSPENITAYTVGMKNRFLDNRLQLNIEAFDWKYRDQQLTYFGIDATGAPGVITANIGRSTIKGAEVEARALVTPTTTLSANIQYLDARYDAFTYLSPVPVYTGCGVTPAGPQFAINCSGQRPFNSPKWTVNLGAQQVIPVGSLDIVLDADTQYRSGRYTGFEYIPQEYVNRSWTTNAQVSIGARDGKYVVAAFVRNIEDSRYQVYATPAPSSNLIVGLNSSPRTFGVRLSTRF